jgi:hypothetical protein
MLFVFLNFSSVVINDLMLSGCQTFAVSVEKFALNEISGGSSCVGGF